MSANGSPVTNDMISHLRENSLGRLLLRASRHYNDEAIERVRRLGHPHLTLAHASILPHIDMEGTRLTDLANRAGLTKQSTSELITSLERLGYVRREADPQDGRSHLLVFTKRGEEFLLAAYQAKSELEGELVKRLGSHRADHFLSLLREYLNSDEPVRTPGDRRKSV